MRTGWRVSYSSPKSSWTAFQKTQIETRHLDVKASACLMNWGYHSAPSWLCFKYKGKSLIFVRSGSVLYVYDCIVMCLFSLMKRECWFLHVSFSHVYITWLLCPLSRYYGRSWAIVKHIWFYQINFSLRFIEWGKNVIWYTKESQAYPIMETLAAGLEVIEKIFTLNICSLKMVDSKGVAKSLEQETGNS